MKTLIFSSLGIVGLLLAGLQHQQLRELRAENATLQQASAEANQLKGDLAKSGGNDAQDESEIAKLREENRDLLKLRNEVNQLRGTRAQFEKVSAENQRLQSLVKTAAKIGSKPLPQPIAIRIDNLINRGLGTPEDAVQTFFWAEHERNSEVVLQSMTSKIQSMARDYVDGWHRQELNKILSLEIVTRRDVDAATVELGIQYHDAANPQFGVKFTVTLALQGAEWRVDGITY
jgi:hypothetical protein